VSAWPPLGEAEPLRQAALDLIAEHREYEAIGLTELLTRGDVGPAWFDAHFEGRDDCLVWAATTELHAFTDRMWEIYGRHADWREGLRAVAYEMADLVEADPRFAVVTTVTLTYGGEYGRLERDAGMHTMIDMVDLGRQEMADPAEIGRAPAEAIVGAIFYAMRAAASGEATIPPDDAVPQFMYMALRPYLGDEVAREELSLPRPVRRLPLRSETRTDMKEEPLCKGGAAAHKLPRVSAAKKPDQLEDGGLPRLPAGRHGLDPDFVIENQRQRIAASMLREVAARGYLATTVTEVAETAGLSRRTFYGFYPSKRECFEELYDEIATALFAAMAEAATAGRGWPERVRAKLGALLGFYALNPDLATFTLIAPPAAGAEPAERYRAFLGELLAALTEGRPKSARVPSEAAELGLMGGLVALIVERVGAGEGRRLAELLPDLAELVLSPYLGQARAVKEARARAVPGS
jgi:AcrR family transcriptional regulator